MPHNTLIQTRCRRLLSRTRNTVSPAAATRATRAAFNETSTNRISHCMERSDMSAFPQSSVEDRDSSRTNH